MKTLYLLRHAEAETTPDPAADHARKLTPKGRRQAEEVGQFMQAEQMQPGFIAASDAARAIETAETVTRHLHEENMLHTDRWLYLAATETLLDEVRQTSDGFSSLMIIGHNPGMGELAFLFNCTHEGFYPATLAIFESTAETWAEMSAANTAVKRVFVPEASK